MILADMQSKRKTTYITVAFLMVSRIFDATIRKYQSHKMIQFVFVLSLVYAQVTLHNQHIRVPELRKMSVCSHIYTALIGNRTITAPRDFGDLGRRAIYFQGAGEYCLLF